MPPSADPAVMELPKKKGQRGRRPRNAPGEAAQSKPRRKRGEEEANEESGDIGCICDFDDDDGFMIQCERCFIWQHCVCMGIPKTNVPEKYLCELCDKREVDKDLANNLQRLQRLKKRDDSSSRESSPARDSRVNITVDDDGSDHDMEVDGELSIPFFFFFFSLVFFTSPCGLGVFSFPLSLVR